MRNAVSLGGDSDTLACITGGLAEALFALPRPIAEHARHCLEDHLRSALKRFAHAVRRRPERLFGFESGAADGAPSSLAGPFTPGRHGLPSAPKLARRGELGN